MAKIIVGFSLPNKWKPYSWLIQTLLGTKYSHVYIKIYSEKFERNLIYQASKTMVNFMGTEIFLKDNVIYEEFEIEISDEKRTQLLQFAIDNAGKPYGFKAAIGMGLVKILSFVGIKIKNPFRDGTYSYVCSEIAAHILEQFNDADFGTEIDEITPPVVYNYLKSR